jgi:hypothetical protein
MGGNGRRRRVGGERGGGQGAESMCVGSAAREAAEDGAHGREAVSASSGDEHVGEGRTGGGSEDGGVRGRVGGVWQFARLKSPAGRSAQAFSRRRARLAVFLDRLAHRIAAKRAAHQPAVSEEQRRRNDASAVADEWWRRGHLERDRQRVKGYQRRQRQEERKQASAQVSAADDALARARVEPRRSLRAAATGARALSIALANATRRSPRSSPTATATPPSTAPAPPPHRTQTPPGAAAPLLRSNHQRASEDRVGATSNEGDALHRERAHDGARLLLEDLRGSMRVHSLRLAVARINRSLMHPPTVRIMHAQHLVSAARANSGRLPLTALGTMARARMAWLRRTLPPTKNDSNES